MFLIINKYIQCSLLLSGQKKIAALRYKLISYAPGENYESLPRRYKLVVVYVHVVINLIALGLTLYGKKNLNFFASRIE